MSISWLPAISYMPRITWYPMCSSLLWGRIQVMSENRIGIVLGSEDATPLQFWIAVEEGRKIQLDDVVYIEVADPASEKETIRFYGVVDEVRRRFEGIQFDGDTELVVGGLMPANVSYAAQVLVTRVEPEEFIPPAPGDVVFLATGEKLEKALYLDNMEAPLPAGVLRNGEVGYFNFDFINGGKGAHINISGISGIATKTSYALFLLYSIFHAKNRKTNKPLVLANATKSIIFNVKGEDLLFLDKPNKEFAKMEGQWLEKRRMQKNRYELCALPVMPFRSVGLYAPAKEGPHLTADIQSREGITPYVWTLHEFCTQRMLPFVLTERDAMTNLGFLVGHIEEKLYKLASEQKGPDLEIEVGDNFSPSESRDLQKQAIRPDEGLDSNGFFERTGRTRLKTFDELVTYLEYKLLSKDAEDEGDKGGDPLWKAQQARGTREALIRRLRGASKHIRRLVRGDLSRKELERGKLDVLGGDKQVHVVDIHSLAPLAQMFVVGVLLKQVFAEQEAKGRGQVFVVLDELNKYAPAEGDSPIKDVLLDIAERGRSLGIILIGAQQTASEVERRVVANAAIRIVGRLDAAEAERPEYRFMPGSFRLRSTILAPGTMIAHQPDVPSPMMLNFPFPSWATRQREIDEMVSDKEALDILG